MKRFSLIIMLFLLTAQHSIAQTNPNIAVKIYKRDTLFNCIAADSLGNVYTASSQRGIFKFDGTVWKDWTAGSGAPGVRKSFMKHMAGGREGVWLTHSGYVLTVTGGGSPPISYNNANGGVEYLPATHPAQRVKYQGRSILARRLVQGPATKSGLAIAIDKNGTVWSGTSYADSQRYYFFDGFTVFPDRYFYSPGGLTYKTAGGAGFDTVVAGMPWPAGINVSIGTDNQTENWSIGKRRIVRAVGVINSINEVWASVDSMQAAGQTFSNCILRYSLAGAYLGKIDNTGTGLPMGPGTGYAGATSIYEDAKGRIWLGFGNKGIGVKDSTGNWTYIPAPPLLPASTQIRPNAISGNKKGEVYFGTFNGLLVYRPVNGNYFNDTSYRLYTTTQGLLSNNILGVTVDKESNIWLATGNGIAQLVRGDLLAFNLKADAETNILTKYNLRRTLQNFNSEADYSSDTMLIAADGSKATLLKWQGADPKNMKIRIKESVGNPNPDEFGSFQTLYRNETLNDSLIVQYTHPKFVNESYTTATSDGRDLKLQVVDTTVNPEKIVMELNLRIILPPVLMVHGVWSSIRSFGVMNSFLNSNPTYRYKSNRLLRIWHSNAIHPEPVQSQRDESDKVPAGIDKLLATCAANKISAGKVDILGHSRGGIFSRIYLQGNFVTYRNDIHKLITINTPHYGSHAANLVLDNRVLNAFVKVPFLDIYKPITQRLGSMFSMFSICEGVDDINGAIELKVNAPALLNELNGAKLNANKTYSHTVTGLYEFGPNFPVSNFIINGLLPGNLPLYVRLQNGTYNRCNLNLPTTVDGLVRTIFNNEGSDLVVPISSQRGGLTGNYTSAFPGVNVAHSNKTLRDGCNPEGGTIQFATSVLDIPVVQNRVLTLLRSKSEGTFFTKDGFGGNPTPPLQYTLLTPNPPCINGSPDLPASPAVFTGQFAVDTAIYGKTFTAGDTLTFKLRSSQIDNIVIEYAGKTIDVFSDYGLAADSVFKFPIPKSATGRIDVIAYGFSQNDLVVDSSWFNAGIPAAAILSSIKVQRYDEDSILRVFKGDSLSLEVLGTYSDTTRDLSFVNGKTFSFEVGGIASVTQPNKLKGLVVGFDKMIVSYGGKTDTVLVEVLEKEQIVINPIPVTFSDIYAIYRNGHIEVNWSTESEINNKEFEVQRSIDGTRFETFAVIPGKTFSSSTSWYNAPDYNFGNGRNFYRIRQVDLDGNYKYSKVVMVLVKEKSAVLLYPNPARSEVNIALSASANAGAVRLVNTLGQQVLLKQVTGNRQTVNLDVSQLQKGVYFTEVLDKNNKRIWGGVFVKE
jgi:Secretion system C-terminal sorting domain/Palmitoyl protein thioesterase